jgi:hypothetical protein
LNPLSNAKSRDLGKYDASCLDSLPLCFGLDVARGAFEAFPQIRHKVAGHRLSAPGAQGVGESYNPKARGRRDDH